MSIKIMGEIWDLDLPREEKYILLAYADHADHEGHNIYPSAKRIAWKTGYDIRHVRRVTKSLVQKGIMAVDRYGGTIGRPNSYSIILENAPRQEPLKSKRGSDKVSPPPWQDVTPHPGRMSPEPSYITVKENIDRAEDGGDQINQGKKKKNRPNPGTFAASLPFSSARIGLESTDEDNVPERISEIESAISAPLKLMLGRRFRRMSKKNRQTLTEPVVLTGKTYPSPQELWDTDPLFKAFVAARCEWFSSGSNSGSKAEERLVYGLRRYEDEPHGWFKWRLDQQGRPLDMVEVIRQQNEDLRAYYKMHYGDDESQWPLKLD